MSLFADAVTPPATHAARTRGTRSAAACAMNADEAWSYHATWLLKTMLPGRKFLAEEIAEQCAAGGFHTSDARALGHVIQEARRNGWIASTGEYRPARTSNGSPKQLWMKL